MDAAAASGSSTTWADNPQRKDHVRGCPWPWKNPHWSLVDDGLVETRQGVGSFVLRVEPVPRPVDVLAELRVARGAINRAIAALEKVEVE